MGFRKDAFAKVWEVKPNTETMVNARISVSKKDKRTGEYVQEWSGYVAFVGSACAKKASGLKQGDRIQLGDVDVTSKYVKEKNTTYTNFNVYSFKSPSELEESESHSQSPNNAVDDGELSEGLPF